MAPDARRPDLVSVDSARRRLRRSRPSRLLARTGGREVRRIVPARPHLHVISLACGHVIAGATVGPPISGIALARKAILSQAPARLAALPLPRDGPRGPPGEIHP